MSYIKPQITPPSPLIFCHPERRVKTAGEFGGSGITTWKTRGKYSPSNLAGGGGTLGVRFGLAHFSNGLWFFDDSSKLTWHLGHVLLDSFSLWKAGSFDVT
jgi:hypothetical protein